MRELTQSVTVRVGVSVYSAIVLQNIDDVVDELVDLALVGAGGECGRVVHAGKL